MKKFSKIILLLCMLVITGTVFAACGAPKITDIKITGVPQYVIVGENFTLEAVLTPEKASQKDVVWSTSDANIASVNESGKVTPLQLGTVIITAMSKKDSSIKDSVSISINSKTTDIIINNLTASYDGLPKSVVAQNAPEGVSLVYKYSSIDYPESETPPVNAGIYSVKVYPLNGNTVLAQCILTIKPRTVVINIDDKSKIFGANDPEFTSSITGLIGADTINYTIGKQGSSEDVGDYVITTTTYEENPNYTISVVNGTLKILQRDVKIIPQNKSSVYGDPLQPLTFEIQDVAGNALNNIDVSNVSGTLKIVTNGNLDKLNAGSYTISSSDLISKNLNIREKSTATYTITKRTAYVAVTANQGKFAGQEDPEITKVISNTAYGDDLSACLSREAGETVGFYQYLLDQTINDNYNLTFTTDNVFAVRANKVTISLESFFIPYSPSQSNEYIPADKLIYIIDINGNSGYATMDNNGYIILDDKKGERVLLGVTLQQVASLTEAEKVNIYQKMKMTPEPIQQEGITDPKKYEYTFIDTYKYITKLELTITANNLQKFYKETDPTFTFEVSGLLSGDTAAAVASTITFVRDKSGNCEDVGTYEIYPDKTKLQDGKDYYKPTFVNGTFTIVKRPIYATPISYTQAEGTAVYYGEPDKPLDFDTTEANLPDGVRMTDVLTGTLTKAIGTDVGTYAITIKGLVVNKNYELHFTPGVYEIIPRPWYVYAANKTITYGDGVNGFLYTDEPYKGDDGSIEYNVGTFGKPIFNGKLALAKNQTLYANNLDDADTTNDYYEIGQGNLTAGSNFTIIFTSGKLTVTKRQVTLSFIPQTYAYGSEQPDVVYAFSPSLASGDRVSRLDYICDNTANANIFVLQKVDEIYNYSLEILNSNNKLVNDCYTININEQATDLFYVGASLLEIKLVSKQDHTSNTSVINYGDIYDFNDLFRVEIVNNTNNYVLEYTSASFMGLTFANPTDAGNYTISVITNPVSENAIKVKTAPGGEDISSNFGFAITEFGMLTINKADLALSVAPIIDHMQYGTQYPSIHDGEYVFYNAALDGVEQFVSSPEDYIVSDYSKNNVNENAYIIRAVFSPDLATNPAFKNFNIYTHEGLELYIIKQEKDTNDLTWSYGESFDHDSIDNGDGSFTVEFDADTLHNMYKSDYETAGNAIVIPEELKSVSPTVAYIYQGIYFSNGPEHRGQLPYVIDADTTGYVSVGNNATYRATVNAAGEISIYYITEDGEGNEVVYLLDNDFIERSSTAPNRAGIFYVTARLSTTNANYTFSKQDFSCLYLVKKAAATVYFVEEQTGVTYNKDLPLELTLTTDVMEANVRILGYKKYINGGTDTEDCAVPVNVGDYIVIVEVDTENHYINEERGFKIVATDLNVVFGTNTEVNFREGVAQSVDFYFTANGVTLFAYTNGVDNLETALAQLTADYPWLKYQFTLYDSLLPDGTYPVDAQNAANGYYKIIFTIDTTVDEGKNYKFAATSATSCNFSIIPKIYSGNIRIDNAEINYDATYEQEGGNVRMYEAIYNAMVKDPNNELLSGDYTLTLKTNSGLIISDTETDFVSVINHAGKSFEITLIISGSNTSATEKTAVLSVVKANMPIFRYYSESSTTIGYTGQRIFNPLTDNNGNIYSPTIQNTAAGTWTYAERGDAETYFGITYTYYKVEGTNDILLSDAPIAIENDVIVQYKVVATVTAGANYKPPAVETYTGLFTIAKTTFRFNSDEERQINYTYGIETDEITIGAKNSAGVDLVLTFTNEDESPYAPEDGIVCLRYYTASGGAVSTSLPKNAGTYTVTFKIISSKTNFVNEGIASDFEATKTLIISPRQIDQCDTLINYSSKSTAADSSLLYAKQIKSFTYWNKNRFPDHLKELFSGSTACIYFNLYDSEKNEILTNIVAANIPTQLNLQPAGTYYFRLSPYTGNANPSYNKTNFSISDYYELIIYHNPVDISFDLTKGNVVYDEDTETYSLTVGYTAAANPFDVSNIKVTGRLSGDREVLTYSDYIVRYKIQGAHFSTFTTVPPTTQGKYDVEIVLKNETYISSDRGIDEDPATAETLPLQIVYEIYAPTLQLSPSVNNYTYKNYDVNNFVIDAYYNGVSRGQYNRGTQTKGAWVLNQEMLDAGVQVTYDGEASPTNVTQLVRDTLADAQSRDPSIRLSTIADFNAQNAGTYVAYVIYISSDHNFAPTIGTITFTIDKQPITFAELTMNAGQTNMVHDTANNKFVYTLPLTANVVFDNGWSFDEISLTGPSNTKLIIVDGSIELEVYINYSTFVIASADLVNSFKVSGTTHHIQAVTITSITESSGNYDLSSLIGNSNFEMSIKVAKGELPNNVFGISNQTVPYNSNIVKAKTFSTSDSGELAFSNYVTLNTSTDSGSEAAYKIFNKAYTDEDKSSFLEFMSFTGIYFVESGVERDVTNDSDYVVSKNRLVKDAQYGTYIFRYAIPESIYFNATTIEFVHNIEPKAINASLSTQLIVSGGKLPMAKLTDGGSSINTFEVQVEIRLASADKNSTPLVSFKQVSITSAEDIAYGSNSLPVNHSNLIDTLINSAGGNNAIFAVTIELLSLGSLEISNMAFANADEGSPRKTTLYALYISNETNLGELDIYQSIDNGQVLESILGSGNDLLIHNLGLSLEWSSAIESALDMSNYILTENVIVAMLTPENLEDLEDELEGTRNETDLVYKLNIADKLNENYVYDADLSATGVQGWQAPVYIIVGEDRIRTTLTMTVKFEITLEVTDTTFAYDGTKHEPNAKLKLYSFNFERVFPYVGGVYQSPIAYYIPVLRDISDQSGLSVVYKKNGTPIANPVGAGEYEAIYTYTIGGIEYKQTIPFTISAELVPVTMNSMEVSYDTYEHGLTATAEKDGTPLNITYEYIDEAGNTSTSKPVNAGVYKVIATVQEDNYEGCATAILTIRKLSTRIEIIDIPNPVYGSGQFVPTYKIYDEADRDITSLITVETPTYKLSQDGSFGTTVPYTAGEFAIKIRILNQTNYFANELIYNYSIARADATPSITIPSATDLVYNEDAKEVLASVADGRTPTIKYNGSTTAPTNVGLYQVEISFPANTNYNAIVEFVVMEITPAQLVVTYTGHDNTDIVEVDYAASLTIPFTSNCDASVNYAGFSYKEDGTLNTTSQSFGTNMPTTPGIYTATHTATDPNYEGTLVFTIKINRISANILLTGTSHDFDGNPYSPGVDDAPFANYTTTYTGNQYDGTPYNATVAPSHAGIYTLTVSFNGNQIYLPTSSSIKFTIKRANANITLTDMSKPYNGSQQTPTVVFKVNGEVVADFDQYQFVFASGAVAPVDAGEYSVYAYSTHNDYNAISAVGKFTISAADVIVVLTNPDGEYTYDTDTGSLINTINGSADISHFDIVYTGKTYMSDGTLCTENNFIDTHIPTRAGEYTATLTSHNYKDTTFTFTILKKTQTIALDNIITTVGNFVSLPPTISGFNIVYSFKSDTDPDYTQVMPIHAGTYSIKAEIVDANYQGSTTATLTISALSSDSTFVYIKNQYFMYTGSDFTLADLGAQFYVEGVEVTPQRTSYEIFTGSSYAPVASIKDVGQYKIIMESGANKKEQLLEVLPQISINYPSNAVYTGENFSNTVTYTFVNTAQQTTAITSNLTFIYARDGKYVDRIVDAGTYTVSLLYKNFIIKQQTFVVAKQDVSSSLPTTLDPIEYGTSLPPTKGSFKVKYLFSVDGGVTYTDKIPNAGTYKVLIVVDEVNFEGEKEVQLQITKRKIVFNIGDIECNYTGTNILLPTVYENFNIFNYNYSPVDGYYSTGTPKDPGEYYVQAVIGETNYEISYPGGKSYFIVKINAYTPDYVVKDLIHTYDGTAKSVTATLTINGVQKKVIIAYSEENPTNIGDYTVTLSVDGDSNFLAKQVTMTINPATPIITYELPQELTYDGNLKEIANPESSSGATVVVKYYKNGSEENPISAGNYTAVLSCPAIGNYAACEVTVAFTINQATPTFSYYIEDDEDVVYDGHEKTGYSINAEYCTVTQVYKQSGVEKPLINAGTYNVTFTITAINDNYRSYTVTTTYTIYKAPNVISYTYPSLVTDGTDKKLTGLETLVSGQTVTSSYKVDGSSTSDYKKAGIYTAVLKSAATDNYLACEITVVYEITKQDTMLALIPITDTTYDTEQQEITVYNPKGIDTSKFEIKYKGKRYDANGQLTVNHGESTTKPTDAGVYTAKIYFKDDNLTTSQIDEITFVIHRKVLNISIALSGLDASDTIVEFNGTVYTATATASNTDAKAPTLNITTTLNGSEATEIKEGGIYELVVDINDKNHVGYARRVLLITKKQAYIFLRSSAVEYGQEIIPEYVLRDSAGNEIATTNTSPIVTLYDLSGNIVPINSAQAGVYKISIIVNSSGYMASGMFPFTIRPTTPQLYYKGDTNILINYGSEDIINLVNFDIKNLYFSVDEGETAVGLLYSGGILLSNAEIKITYSTIVDGNIVDVELDLSTNTVVPDSTNAYTVTIKANKDGSNDNFEIIELSCLITVGTPIM